MIKVNFAPLPYNFPPIPATKPGLPSLELLWIYKVFLKDRRSVYEIKRFMNEYMGIAGLDCSFGGTIKYKTNLNMAGWWQCGRIKCKDVLFITGGYTFKENIRAVKDTICGNSMFLRFQKDL